MSVLLERQFLFTKLVAKFVEECFLRGYACKLRETGLFEKRRSRLRVPFKDGVHSGTKSKYGGLHYMQLATDVDLFVWVPETGQWRYITSTDHPAWQAMGEFWVSLDPLCRWGGNFSRKDGNHISVTYQERA
jgi:hypothetical protein